MRLFLMNFFLLAVLSTFSLKSQNIEKSFQHPPANARPYTFWMWVNGNVSKEGITNDLEAMKAVGIGGFLQFDGGLGFPQGPVVYNSEKYHEMMSFAFSESQRLGLDAGFNNASGWSSTGGPWITPENSMKMVVWSDTIIHGGESKNVNLRVPDDRNTLIKGNKNKQDFYKDIVVLAFPTPKNNDFRIKNWQGKALLELNGRSDKFVSEAEEAPEDAIIPMNSILKLSDRMDAQGNLNWIVPKGDWTIVRFGYTSTGAQNRPGSKGAIGLEIDKLSRKAVDVHWDAVVNKLIEDGKGKSSLTSITIDSYEVGQQNWTEGFEKEFLKRRGYDLIPQMVCLTGRAIDNTETTERILWDLRKTVSELMQENYFDYFAEKCHARGLKLAIEPYGTGSFDAPATALMADIPITEFWHEKQNRNLWQWTSIVAPSGAHLSGRSIVGAESYTKMRGDFKDDPYSLKQNGDYAFARGVNRYYFHATVHQPWNDAVKPGMTFGPFGTNFHRNNTWFLKSGAWMDYIARCQFIFQSGTWQADILALYGDDRGFNCFVGETEKLDVKFLPGLNTDLGGMSSLNNLTVDPNGDIRVIYKGKLLDTHYKLLLLMRADFMLPENIIKLGALAEKGAKIYAPRPIRTPSWSNYKEAEKLLQTLTKKYWDSGLIRESKDFEAKVKTMIPDCEAPDSILFNRTRIGNDDYYFISNQKYKSQNVTCRFRVSGKQPEIWDPINGEITKVANWKMLANGTTEAQIPMTPVGSAFVVFRKTTNLKGASTANPESKKLLDINGPWKVNFDPNWGPKSPVTFDVLIPWNENLNEEIKYFSGSANYQTEFFIDKSLKSELQKSVYLDLGKVENLAKVRLNGKDLGTLWMPPYQLDISKALKVGSNILEVEVTNLWVNRLIGDERFPDFDKKSIGWLQAGQALPADAPRKTFLFTKQWKKDDKLLPSGLMGPVVIEVRTNNKL